MDPMNDRYTNTHSEMFMLRETLASKCMKCVTERNAIVQELENLERKKQKLMDKSHNLNEKINAYDMEIGVLDKKMEESG